MLPLAVPRQPSYRPARATPRKQHGMTLVELVITIVIIGIAAAALFSAMASITARSADPMLRQQSLYIAEAYLGTLLVVDLTNNPPLIPAVEALPHGIDNEPILELSGYRVTVVLDNNAKLGPSGEQVDATRIDVSVKDPSGQVLTLTGYRTDY
ncbi:prepilin-type N-terminal cleavage/methylation domain-containing protein [Stutzerimonas balearica]|jgi:MSHA pilin protein MshD|uniref:prepilin-type N-terminal cleavage/methylation domain-containing protein n=1 Tax=Stutzerimonas balearica TaxID=74829 RepID=UPI001F11281E|nr:prepilin-type N-terminal cleavage/methylation domain-containing protein [Stutzerimonas balearica]